jgi:hypothetical protein
MLSTIAVVVVIIGLFRLLIRQKGRARTTRSLLLNAITAEAAAEQAAEPPSVPTPAA